MRRSILVAMSVAAVAAAMLPAKANGPTQRDIPSLLQHAPDRYTANVIGKEYNLSYVFGPYTIPGGQDMNRITADLPLNTGFMIAVAPDLVDATSGKVPTQQEAHIHHAHWFRVEQGSPDGGDSYESAGPDQLTWVFGTGEEKTQGRLDDRANADPTGPMYGIPTDGTTPQALIYMIHNKTSSPLNVFVVLDVSFIPGTRAQIEQAWAADPTVSPLASHKTIHPLFGTLWGQTKDVTYKTPGIGADYVATHDGTAVASGAHVHPGGKDVHVVNLGPKVDTGGGKMVPACIAANADPDGDGYPGVTILDSKKFDRVPDVTPYSENYQMGATKFGWRAPIHKGDVLRQIGDYAIFGNAPSGLPTYGSVDGLDHSWLQAMSYTGIYIDREQTLAGTAEDTSSAASACSMSALAPHLIGADDFTHQGYASNFPTDPANVDVQEISSRYQAGVNAGMVNHVWQNVPEPLCGLGANFDAAPWIAKGMSYRASCGPTDQPVDDSLTTTVVHVSGFLYLPGDLNTYAGSVPMIPAIKQGQSLTFVNDDVATDVRHTVTSCKWPCLGTYVSNFPVPTGGPGSFDSGKLGNLDPIDGGLTGADTVPIWTSPTNLAPGKYAYFCRIHPFMRGAFEVLPA